MINTSEYTAFLEGKVKIAGTYGFGVDKDTMHTWLYPHDKDAVAWALQGGRRALFESFGMHKTTQQLIIANEVIKHTGKPFLIGLPLGVRQEFMNDWQTLIEKKHESFDQYLFYVRDMREVAEIDSGYGPVIYMTNYERIRENNFDPSFFGGVSLDEASILRGLDTKTSDYILNNFSTIPYRFVCTATPSPNEYTEILNYAQFLGVMDRGQALTRFFQRDSKKAGNLTLYPHKEEEFWLWVSSWALFITKPSDLGYSDAGYDLPPVKIIYHEVSVKERDLVVDRKTKQIKHFANPAKSLPAGAKEKRISIDVRINKMLEIMSAGHPDDHWLIWHHLEDERRAIEAAVPGIKTAYGSQDEAEKEDAVIGFANGTHQHLATKPEMFGSGANFQRHCHKAIFLGIDDKFNDFIQAIHRILRFLQLHEVEIHILSTDAEQERLKRLQQKWARHNKMIEHMVNILKKFGLSKKHKATDLSRTMGVGRKEEIGRFWRAINNDNVIELNDAERWKDNSVKLILTSIPFSDQYEYCESFHDMGHNSGNGEFFKQMDFLTPNLLRILDAGRVAAIHVKDRIRYSYQNGQSFTTLHPFSDEVVQHFTKHGFWYLGRITVVTDVVQENNQTYRLGWSENCKDASKMGVGLPEYILLFRKAPTDSNNAYADNPVQKSKDNYSRGRWQLDAHSLWKSNGNRLITAEEIKGFGLDKISALWKQYDNAQVYDYEKHVELCENLDGMNMLPSSFMALPPHTGNSHVWDNVNRMDTLNTKQTQKKKEKHVCPLQFDIVDRLINRFSMEGEIVLDPFGGLMTIPYRSIHLKRAGVGIELNSQYYADGMHYCKVAEQLKDVPSLFDAINPQEVNA